MLHNSLFHVKYAISADERGVKNSGLLLLSITDFGYPNLVTLALAVEKPVDGVLRLATSVQYGEPEDDHEESAETYQYGRPGKRFSQTHSDEEDV